MNGLSDESALRFWGAALLADARPGAAAMDYGVFENLRPPYLRRLAAMLHAPAP